MTVDYAQRHILFVDDEPASQRLVTRVVMAGIPGARVTCASDGLQALQVLEREAVDLLITDLMMPGMDGIELLRQVANRQWMLPIMVLSGQGSRTLETGALAGMAIECFEKPLEAGPFLNCVRELLEVAARRSYLQGVSIAGFVQLLSMEGKTCTLRATVPGAQGVLYFQAGQLVDAREGQRSGAAAALEIFAWTSPTITLEALVRDRPTTIHASIMELLLESARLADERERRERRGSAQARSAVRGDIDLACELSDEDMSPSPPSVPAIEPRISPPPSTLSAPDPRTASTISASTVVEALPAPAPAGAPARPDADRVAPAAPRAPDAPAVAWPRGVPETCDCFELIDHARDLMRVAEFETAEALLLRALAMRPGDRVIQQNLRALARRRGA